MIPFYKIAINLDLIDTPITLILAYVSFNQPFAVWLMKGFFEIVPKELDDAPMIDCCRRLRAFATIILPATSNGIATTLLMTVVLVGSEYFFALVLTDRNAVTLPVRMTTFLSQTSTLGSTYSMTAAVEALIPMIVLSVFLQKRLVTGLTFGTVKG